MIKKIGSTILKIFKQVVTDGNEIPFIKVKLTPADDLNNTPLLDKHISVTYQSVFFEY
jgi:hypothetical protein